MNFRKSEATERWCPFCFTVSSHGTNFAEHVSSPNV